MYAVLETGSKQYRVAVGDTLQVERLGVEPGQVVTFDRVLLINHNGKLMVGSPMVASARVVADVVDNIRDKKKLTYKLKRRKGYRKTIGHRQELTVVKIKEINGEGIPAAEAVQSPAAVPAPKPAKTSQPGEPPAGEAKQ